MPELRHSATPSSPRGLGLEVVPVTASFTWDETYNDRVIRSDGASGITITLPSTVPVGSRSIIVDVYNAGANPISVFPNGASDTIDGGSAGAAVTLTNAKRCRYTCFAANTIISAQLGVASA